MSTIRNAIRAESKQAIASLIQVGASPRFRYTDLPDSVEGVRFFLESFDWQKHLECRRTNVGTRDAPGHRPRFGTA